MPYFIASVINAAENFHQGGLACPVLAAERQHLAFADFKTDLIQRDDAREAFGNAAHFDQWHE
jgi:hypothetical protein